MPEYTPIAVAYTKRKNGKVWVKEFTDQRCVDKIISSRTKLLPSGSEIVEIGVGKIYYERYKKKYD